METNQKVEATMTALATQARAVWGKADVMPQPEALRATATELVLLAETPLPAELEPRFF